MKPPRRLRVSRYSASVPALPTDRPKVNIMRPGPWGNPFVVGRDGDKLMCIAKHETWLKDQFELLNERHRLRGRDLLCCCAEGTPCHGDTWLRVANMTRDELFDWMLA